MRIAPRSRPSTGSVRLGLLLALTCLLVQGHSRAQDVEGVVPLRTGFTPDPAVLYGDARGERSLSIPEAPACAVGFFPDRPSHVLMLETRVGFMRFYATGPSDLAIAVHDAEGLWHCNDDRFGRHPSVEGTWMPGRVEVFVGTHTAGERSEYQLRLTETRSMRPGVGPDGGDAGDERALARDAGMEVDATSGRFDGIRLRRGFLPDPRFLAGDTALPEGEEGVDASLLSGDCHGVVSRTPSHIVELLDDLDFFQLYVAPLTEDRWSEDEAPELALMVLRPDGTFVCDPADGGIELSFSHWVPGVYRVWVGTDLGGTPARYRLGTSEIRRVR